MLFLLIKNQKTKKISIVSFACLPSGYLSCSSKNIKRQKYFCLLDKNDKKELQILHVAVHRFIFLFFCNSEKSEIHTAAVTFHSLHAQKLAKIPYMYK